MENALAGPVQAWLTGFAEAALAPGEVEDFVRSIDDEIIASIPEIARDPVLVADLHASTRAHWRNFLVGLSDEFQLALPPSAVALSVSIARRHLDINVLLKVYRVANKSVFRYLNAEIQEADLPAGMPRGEVLIMLWLRAERWIDESIEQLIDHYTEERALLADGAQARRTEAIEALLAGAEPTSAFDLNLGHKLTPWQTAFVLSAPVDRGSDARLFDVAVQLCQRLGLPRPLTHSSGSRELWGWVATPERPEPDLASVAELVAKHGLHLAFGTPRLGPGAFRASHLEAVAAQRVGLRTPDPCHDYRRVEMVSLLGQGELARAMVMRVIGPLVEAGNGAAALRDTALTYLRLGQSADDAAARLFVHRNTVRYRIGRVEELLGRRLAQDAAAIEICLAWLEIYGESALSDPVA